MSISIADVEFLPSLPSSVRLHSVHYVPLEENSFEQKELPLKASMSVVCVVYPLLTDTARIAQDPEYYSEDPTDVPMAFRYSDGLVNFTNATGPHALKGREVDSYECL
jgi:hypothetical protein